MLTQTRQIAKVKPVNYKPAVRTALKLGARAGDVNLWAADLSVHFDMNGGPFLEVTYELLLPFTKRGHFLVVDDDVQKSEFAEGAGVSTDLKLCHCCTGAEVRLCGLTFELSCPRRQVL